MTKDEIQLAIFDGATRLQAANVSLTYEDCVEIAIGLWNETCAQMALKETGPVPKDESGDKP